MKLNEYAKLAMITANKELSDEDKLLNGILGLCGEAGECSDIVKKHLFQKHTLNVEKLIDEMGDCLWYIAELCDVLGVSMEHIARHNIDKLKKRYPDGFEVERSVNRKEYLAFEE